MGKTQSKPTTEEYEQCKVQVKDCDKQLKQCSTRDHNQMESSQTNLGIFSLGVENNSNGSGECNCRFWRVEALPELGVFGKKQPAVNFQAGV